MPRSNVALGTGSSGHGVFHVTCTGKLADSILLGERLGMFSFL